ncbi:neuronal acetylcholine receptor subunit alpha-2-like isoform X2 [Liolophura sinensis]|uniref:neuronal acetylcholine receptor subunit alpha-2-like isoform X2 n=1 Tax=Liolophura sinensis TaxID=3198878 RepID=UPI0031592E47
MSPRVLMVVVFGLLQAARGNEYTTNDTLAHIDTQTKLYHKLMDGYEEHVRPAANQSSPVLVGFGLSLLRLVDLNEHLQELVLDVMLRKTWADPRLAWEPDDFDGIEQMRVPVQKLWKPDIVLYNNAADDYSLMYDPFATVYHTGVINWIPKALIRSHCAMDMTNFPFDVQQCYLMFGTWAYTGKEVNLTYNPTREESVDVEDYTYSKEWQFIDHSWTINNKKYSCCVETFPDFSIQMVFKRNPTFYTHMYLMPALLLAFIAPCVFILPPESKEKVTLGGIILLCLTVSMTSLEEILPSEQFNMPIIALYEAITMVLVAVSIILCVIITNLHSRGPRKKKIFLQGLKRVACFGEDTYYPLDEMETISMRGLDRHMTEAESNQKASETSSSSKMEKDVEQILKHMRGVAIRNSVSDARADIRSEWQLVAMVIDRLLFGLYVLMIFITTVGVFA